MGQGSVLQRRHGLLHVPRALQPGHEHARPRDVPVGVRLHVCPAGDRQRHLDLQDAQRRAGVQRKRRRLLFSAAHAQLPAPNARAARVPLWPAR